MTVTARKYNPGFLSDDELIASFCVRTGEFASMVEVLRDSTGTANTHQIVIGPRGSGKTSLLLRVAAEIRRDADLSSRFFPIVFAEESYEVSTAGEFWLECLSRLADQAPRGEDGPDLHRTVTELRQIQDDRTLGDRCLGVLQDFADREGRRLVMLVENLNMMFRDIADDDAGWRLRQTLQNDPRFLLLASATSRFDEIDKRDFAFYDLFRTTTLHRLDTDDCATLWRTVSGSERAKKTIRALQILTGGSPRLLTIVARFGGNLSFRELMADLLDLVDDHTEYFKSHLEALPAQERRVYLALADLWKPATTREIAERARLDTSKCSAQLARLTERGAVEVTGGSPRRKLYYLAERLYNIYYLMRRARGPVPMIEALIRLMEGMYAPDELVEFGARIAHEATGLDDETQSPYRIAFSRLTELQSLAAHREKLRSLAPWMHAERPSGRPYVPAAQTAAKTLFDKALALVKGGHLKEALAAWNEIVQRFGSSQATENLEQVAGALINKGMTLGTLNRTEEALEAWDEVVRRFGAGHTPSVPSSVARALVNKASALGELKRPKEALGVCDELLHRFGASDEPKLIAAIATALVCRGLVLGDLNRHEVALATFDEVVHRFGTSDRPAILEQVASALLNKGTLLAASNRVEEALEAWGDLVQRFGESGVPGVLGSVAMGLANAGTALVQLNRPKEALAVWDEVIRCYGTNDSSTIVPIVVKSLSNRGSVLVRLKKPEEAIESWDEIVRRWGMSAAPALLQQVSIALSQKGNLLGDMGRTEDALTVWDEVAQRFGKSDVPELYSAAAEALVNKGVLLVGANRQSEALATWDEVVQRFWSSDAVPVRDTVAIALFNKGATLAQLKREDEALTIWDEVVRRFGPGDTPIARDTVALSLVNKGGALIELNRLEEGLETLDEVIQRYGSSDSPSLMDAVSTALLGKGAALAGLNRPEEALAVCDEVVQRNETREAPELREVLASALVNKGNMLAALKKPEEASAVWDDVVERFEMSDLPALRRAVQSALISKAAFEFANGRAKSAIVMVDEAYQREIAGFPESRSLGHLIRARAHLVEGDTAACAQDVATVLVILSTLSRLPKEALDALSGLAVDLGPQQMRDLIVASPAADLLLPLTTALELELGLEPRVAKEVEEVAEDIRRDLAERREAKSA